MESSGIALYSGYLWTTNALTASVFVDEIADTTKCSNVSENYFVKKQGDLFNEASCNEKRNKDVVSSTLLEKIQI